MRGAQDGGDDGAVPVGEVRFRQPAFKRGVRREGAYYGITQFMYKIASGVSIALVSLVLEAFGYTESMDGTVIDQPDSALMAVRVVLGVLPGVIFLVSIVFSHRANMGRDRFNTIKEELAKRRAAAENDVSGESAAADTADSASHGGGKFAE